MLSKTGGIRPAERKRFRILLTLSEREEISRELAQDLSIRSFKIAIGKLQKSNLVEMNVLRDCLQSIVGTGKIIHQNEKDALDFLDRELA